MSQETNFMSEEYEKDKEESLVKKPHKDIETGKENIDLNSGNQKEAVIHPKKFNGPGQKPNKTANKAFGDISDFVLFFENRSPEMKEFAKEFEKIERMDSESSVNELNSVIVPKIDECLDQMYQKIKVTTESKLKKCENKYAKLFKNSFLTWKEFYKQVFRAYTISGFLYKKMNEYLRNEDWMQLDALLPYVYCLFKAFLWGPDGLTRQESFEALKAKLKGNKLILFRGADFDDESLEFYDPAKTKNFSWNGVISTSLEESVTKKFQGDRSKRPILITIEINFENLQPANLNALYLAEFSEYPKEEEVVLPPGSIFELLEINKENPEVVMRLRLVTNVEALAHKGQFLHGLLQAIMRNENELKIVCLKEKELSRALKHCQGNRLIKKIEFCFCIFNKKAIRVFKEAIPTIENMTSVILNIVKFEEDCRLDEMLECLEKTRIKGLKIFPMLDEKRHIEAMVESMKYLRSLEYLKLGLEEDYQMASLLQDFLATGCQYLNSKCIFDVDIGTRYNLVTKGSNLSDFESFDIMKAMNKNWPPCWGPPPKSTDETKFMSSHSQVKQHPEKNQKIEEKPLSGRETQTTKILDHGGLKDERNENIEIIESSLGMRELCLEDIEKRTLLEALESKFRLNLKKENSKFIKEHDIQDAIQEEFQSQGQEGSERLELLTSLHLSFDRNDIFDKEGMFLCSRVLRYLQSLKIFYKIFYNFSGKGVTILSCQGTQKITALTSIHLNFEGCYNITDADLKILGFEGMRHLPLLTSLHLKFKQCKGITDEGLKILGSEGIRHLPLLTSLHLNFKQCEIITDEGLKTLGSEGIRHLHLLTSLHLNFERCYRITDVGLKILGFEGIRYVPLLTSLHLDFRRWSRIIDVDLKILGFEGMRHLPLLTSLHLKFKACDRITDQGLKTLGSEGIRHLHLLTSLHLNFEECDRITDEGLKILGFEGMRHLPLLTSLHLNFERCYRITDEGLKVLGFEGIRHLHLLTSLHLNFERCYRITDEGLKILGFEGMRHLPLLTSLHLNFESCKNITDEGLKALGSEGIRHLPLLTSLHLDFRRCFEITDEGLETLKYEGIRHLHLLTSLNFQKLDFEKETRQKFLSTMQPNIDSLSIDQHQSLQTLNLSPNFSCSPFQSLSNSNQNTAFAVYNVRPGFYFKEAPFICAPNIPKLLLKNFPFYSEDFGLSKETQKNCQATFHLNFKSQPINDDFSNLDDTASSWQNVKTLNLIFNDCSLSTPQGLQSYWHILQYFKSIVELNISCNEVSFPLDEGLSSLFHHGRFENFKSLKRINLIFPKGTISERAKTNILRALSSFDLNLLTLKKLEIKKADLKMSKQSVQFNFKKSRQKNRESELKSALNEKTYKRHFGCQDKITNSQEKFKPFPSRDITIFKNQNIPIQELNFQELLNLKSLLILDLIFFGYYQITDERLKAFSVRMSDFELLKVLNLSFYGCRLITDEGLLELSSQGLKQLRKLTELSLNFGFCNRITEKGLDDLNCEGIKHLEFLTKLNLNFECCLGLEILSCKGIEFLKRLTELHLNFNSCTGIIDIGSEWISESLQNLKSLTILSIDFGYDKVHNLDLRSISQGIQYLQSLTDLHLNFNHCTRITDLGLEWLSHGLQNLKLLTNLSLNFDKCPGIFYQSIKSLSCGGIRYLKSLTSLHLSFDGVESRILTDEVLESLCEGIQHLDNLKTLELISQSKNQITDQGIKNLAFKAMAKLASLENLQLPLMQTATSSSSIIEAFRNILIYFGLQKAENL